MLRRGGSKLFSSSFSFLFWIPSGARNYIHFQFGAWLTIHCLWFQATTTERWASTQNIRFCCFVLFRSWLMETVIKCLCQRERTPVSRAYTTPPNDLSNHLRGQCRRVGIYPARRGGVVEDYLPRVNTSEWISQGPALVALISAGLCTNNFSGV